MAAPKKTTEEKNEHAAPTTNPTTASQDEGHVNGAGEQTPEASIDSQENMAVDSGPKLQSLSALAERHRVPSWQQAALCRFMGWADGKMLTDAEYGDALKKLSARHLGGGRRS